MPPSTAADPNRYKRAAGAAGTVTPPSDADRLADRMIDTAFENGVLTVDHLLGWVAAGAFTARSMRDALPAAARRAGRALQTEIHIDAALTRLDRLVVVDRDIGDARRKATL